MLHIGTSAIITCSAISRLATQSIVVERPPGYMENNETGDACMLMATHQNAMEWHLFTGERAVVDALLNKTMFTVPDQRGTRPIAQWLQIAHMLHLLAMTFVAAQKGWDGVCLVILLTLDWVLRHRFRGCNLARSWLADEGVEAELKSFKFTGRMAMLGAIQTFSRTNVSSWMDEIVAPHPRRDAWLKRMQGLSISEDGWSSHDLTSIERNAKLSCAAAEVLERELSKRGV